MMRGWLLSLLLLPGPLASQGLFKDTRPVELRVVTDLRTFLRVRDSTELVAHAARITWSDSGRTGTVEATMRARGHFRRQSRNCTFPPVRLQLTKDAAAGSLFQGNRKVEVTTTCRPATEEYDQYVLREYSLYRAFNVLTPWSHRTRLARITWADSANRVKEVQMWAFLIEAPGEIAERRKAVDLEESKGAKFDDLDPNTLGIAAFWEYMIANHDWSVSALHNIRLMRREEDASIHAVAYDFDFSGAVNTRYATPPPQFRLRTVRDRLYRGPCLTAEQWAPIAARYKEKRAEMEAEIAAVPSLEERWRTDLADFLRGPWKMLDDPVKLAKDFKGWCQPGN